MAIVNADERLLYYASTVAIECDLKVCAKDFQVHEITLDNMTVENRPNFLQSAVPALDISLLINNSSNSLVVTTEDRFDEIGIMDSIDNSIIDKLRQLNEDTQRYVFGLPRKIANELAVSIRIVDYSKVQRKFFYQSLFRDFPYLKTIYRKDEEFIHITSDNKFAGLAAIGLSEHDIDALAKLDKQCSNKDISCESIMIGTILTRDARGLVYRFMTEKCPYFKLKTVEGKSADERAIQVSFRRKRKVTAFCVQTACLQFTVIKHDTDHFSMMSRVAAISGIAATHISFAGIKDARAITSQRGTMLIQSDPEKPASAESFLEFARVCESVAQSLVQCTKHNLRASNTREVGGGIASSASYIALGDLSFVSTPLRPGDLWGNAFKISLRRFPRNREDDLRKAIEVLQIAGFPNLFGSQRMGGDIAQSREVDTVNLDRADAMYQKNGSDYKKNVSIPFGPAIGRALLKGDFIEVVKSIISFRSPNFLSHLCSLPQAELIDSGDGNKIYGSVCCSFFRSQLDVSGLMPREYRLVRGLIHYGCCPHALRICVARGDRPQFAYFLKSFDDDDDYYCRVCAEANTKLSVSHTADITAREYWERQQELYKMAVLRIPHAHRQLWVHAYQSWMWNRAASHRLTRIGHQPVAGDLVLSSATPIPGEDQSEEALASHGLDCANFETERGVVSVLTDADVANRTDNELLELSRRIVIPLFGTKVRHASNETGLLYRQELLAEGMSTGIIVEGVAGLERNGKLALGSPYPQPKGAYRPLFQSVFDPQTLICPDDTGHTNDDTHATMEVSFKLPAGSYATVFLAFACCNEGLL